LHALDLQALAGAGQERAKLLPRRRGHRTSAGCRWVRPGDELLMLTLDEHLLVAELGDAAIGCGQS